MRPPLLATALVLALSVAGCTAPQPDPDAPDLAAETLATHRHGGQSSYPPCTYTLTVGPEPRIHDAMVAGTPPPNATVETRTPAPGVHIDLRHEATTIEDVRIRYAYYRVFGEGRSVQAGVTVYGTDPITVGATGSWPDQEAVPAALRDALVEALGVGGADASRTLWHAWRQASAAGEESAAIVYREPHRLGAAWTDLFGDSPMPPPRPERVYIAKGEATMEEGPWVWGVTASYQTWTVGNRTVHADAFGRYTVTMMGAHPQSVVESHLLDWRLPVPGTMFISLQPACR